MIITNKEADFILRELDLDRLTDWEKGFVESVGRVRNADVPLTNKQLDCLSKIWDKQGDR